MSESAVTVVGNIAKQPEARMTPKGSKVVSIAVASHRGMRTEDGWSQTETSYFDVELWDTMADNAISSLTKGMSILVHGYIRTNSWTDDEGKKRFKQKLIAKAIGPNLRWQKAKVTRAPEPREFVENPSETKESHGTGNGFEEGALTASISENAFNSSEESVPITA